MTPTELVTRVTLESAATVAALAVVAGGVAGLSAALGLLAGGGLAIGNFWWLSGRALALRDLGAANRSAVRWAPAVGVRYMALSAAFAGVFLIGWAHPVAVIVGLTVLPCALVAVGLRLRPEGD
jgi:hypothetical protein